MGSATVASPRLVEFGVLCRDSFRIHSSVLHKAGGKREGHLAVIGVASEAPVGSVEVTDFAVDFPNIGGTPALYARSQNVSTDRAEKAAHTAVFMVCIHRNKPCDSPGTHGNFQS